MENVDEKDDLKLFKASAALLADLEAEIPKLLWKRAGGSQPRCAHTRVKKRDVDRVVDLIEPFQGEPQLLDAKLRILLPPIGSAYLEDLGRGPPKASNHVHLQTAVCNILYTFCKVRGPRVVVGSLTNEARYLEPILESLESTTAESQERPISWQVPYVLLLWLSHLLLTPFDLESISAQPSNATETSSQPLPALASRLLHIGLAYLSKPTKAQEAAAALLVRLCIRPDVVQLRLADHLSTQYLTQLSEQAQDSSKIYEALGCLRLLTGIASAAELSYLIPTIYPTCHQLFDGDEASPLSSNAVAKKIAIKLFRNVSILAVRSVASTGPLLSFLQTTSVIEDIIDYLLRSLGDRDTPVRYAAAKAIGLIVLELELETGHEVIQAVLDSFKQDILMAASVVDFSIVDPLPWHGLTLALGHSLSKRSASPQQLPDIFDALISALQFQQRTATGTMLGTNVRDAANFGIWSLARRYTTAELLAVRVHDLHKSSQVGKSTSIIQLMAVQLVLSACLDPAGNIRRGSSAALQELVGRHPDQVVQGIALVQTVDYQAVSLRRRAMIDVAYNAAALHSLYAEALIDGLFKWRGLWSADVASRESAASALAQLATVGRSHFRLFHRTLECVGLCDAQEVENLHGYALTAAKLLHELGSEVQVHTTAGCLVKFELALHDFSPRTLRSELPAAIARFISAACTSMLHILRDTVSEPAGVASELDRLEAITERLLARHEGWILDQVPDLVRELRKLRRVLGQPLGCIGAHSLCKRVSVDGLKSSMTGAGRAVALGALAGLYGTEGLEGETAAVLAVQTLSNLLLAVNMDWRVTAVSALELVAGGIDDASCVGEDAIHFLCKALRQGLNDYTIDERGDVGSLVRLQCISCSSKLLDKAPMFEGHVRQSIEQLRDELARLSLEKLDRVRLQAARGREELNSTMLTDVASVSSHAYFKAALKGILLHATNEEPGNSRPSARSRQEALLQGCISCAGIAAESVLQPSRRVLAELLLKSELDSLQQVLTAFTTVFSRQLVDKANMHPALELLAFLLDMQIPQRVSDTAFQWRTLLSIVQKSHHKSNDMPKILAAVRVYIGLADAPAIRGETITKLVSMLTTNPYPRVRIAVAEALYVVTGREELKAHDWARPPRQLKDVADGVRKALVEGQEQ